jgi:glyoxylase-like metal-dependent hydrolase (beta-lactamase superfamily II)
MDRIIIKQILIGPYGVFTYILACQRTRKAVIIDPAGEVDRVHSFLKQEYLTLKWILNTHGHMDHVVANKTFSRMFKIPICMHEADDDFFSHRADIRLQEGSSIIIGDQSIRVVHTPGHTPGSACYLIDGNLFTGDTLFVGSAGRTDLKGGSLNILLDSICERILPLPDETVIWPGHDYGETKRSTLGKEREENIYITDMILGREQQNPF